MTKTPRRFVLSIWLLKGGVALALAGTVACAGASSTGPPRSVTTIYTAPSYTVPSETVSHNYNYTTSTSTSTSVSHIYVHQDINAHPGGQPVQPIDQPVTSNGGEDKRQPDAIDQGNHQEGNDLEAQQPAESEPAPPEEQPPQAEPEAPAEPPAAEPEPPKEEAPAAEPPADSPPSDSGGLGGGE